jgi:hypothetical protein
MATLQAVPFAFFVGSINGLVPLGRQFLLKGLEVDEF